MRPLIPLLALFPLIASAQIKPEPVPDLEANLAVSTDIDTRSDFEAPKMQGSLRGMESNLPAVRTAESVAAEVQENQSRLTHLYKVWKMREAEGIDSRLYGLSLTILPSGAVAKVVVKGPTNKDFLKEMEANVSGWSFSPVKDGKPYVANLKNLDFTYRRNRVLE